MPDTTWISEFQTEHNQSNECLVEFTVNNDIKKMPIIMIFCILLIISVGLMILTIYFPTEVLTLFGATCFMSLMISTIWLCENSYVFKRIMTIVGYTILVAIGLFFLLFIISIIALFILSLIRDVFHSDIGSNFFELILSCYRYLLSLSTWSSRMYWGTY